MEETRNVELLNKMMAEIGAVRDSGRAVKQKGGKMYTMVQDRVETLRRIAGDYYRINTDILQWEAKEGATVVVKATIRDSGGMVVATGHAEEIRGANYINETSVLENCETSAIGRALAVLGIHGGEFASADEIKIAEGKRGKAPDTQPLDTQSKKTSNVKAEIPTGPTIAPDKTQSKFLKGVEDKLGDAVRSVENNVPVMAPSKDHELIEEAFATFIPLCTSVNEQYEFWHRNAHILKALEEDAPDYYARVLSMFKTHKENLTKKGQ